MSEEENRGKPATSPLTTAERLDRTLARLKDANPFGSEFGEYKARLNVGSIALERYAAKGKPKNSDMLSPVVSAAQRAAAWYEEVRAKSALLNCEIHLVEYVKEGIPAPLAARFFSLSVPPNHAVTVYRMIYPVSETGLTPLQNTRQLAEQLALHKELQNPPTEPTIPPASFLVKRPQDAPAPLKRTFLPMTIKPRQKGKK